jgi:hypothetical protein
MATMSKLYYRVHRETPSGSRWRWTLNRMVKDELGNSGPEVVVYGMAPSCKLGVEAACRVRDVLVPLIEENERKQRVFQKVTNEVIEHHIYGEHPDELGPDLVHILWKEIENPEEAFTFDG